MIRHGWVQPVAVAAVLGAFGSIAQGQVTIFSTDFDNGAPPEFSGVTTTESVQGYEGVGACRVFSGDFLRNPSGCPAAATTLTLTGLPPHSFLDLRFLLAIIDTWDGLQPPFGPDFLEVTVDGTLVFAESFQNSFGGGHPYVAPPGVLLADQIQMGFRSTGTNDLDAAFDMRWEPAFQGIPHTASTLTVTWMASGAGWHHTCAGGDADESWAIDNVEVVLDPVRELCLRADPPSVQAADPLVFTTAGGLPQGLLLFYVVDLNGTPLNLRIGPVQFFDSEGRWILSSVTPPGLAGLDATFLSLGLVSPTDLGVSNPATVTFL